MRVTHFQVLIPRQLLANKEHMHAFSNDILLERSTNTKSATC